MPPSDDEHERLLCRKNPGKRGAVYEDWEKEYLDAAGGKGDEDASWEDTYLGRDTRVCITSKSDIGKSTRFRHSQALRGVTIRRRSAAR